MNPPYIHYKLTVNLWEHINTSTVRTQLGANTCTWTEAKSKLIYIGLGLGLGLLAQKPEAEVEGGEPRKHFLVYLLALQTLTVTDDGSASLQL